MAMDAKELLKQARKTALAKKAEKTSSKVTVTEGDFGLDLATEIKTKTPAEMQLTIKPNRRGRPQIPAEALRVEVGIFSSENRNHQFEMRGDSRTWTVLGLVRTWFGVPLPDDGFARLGFMISELVVSYIDKKIAYLAISQPQAINPGNRHPEFKPGDSWVRAGFTGDVNYLVAQAVIEALKGAAKDPSLLMTIEEWKRSTNRFPARTYRKVTSTVEPSGIKILRSRTEDDDDSADDTADAAEETAASVSADSDDPLDSVKL